MKEKGPTPSNIISRNWVLKRKRKRLTCGTDVSLNKEKEDVSAAEPARQSSSAKDLQNTETKLEQLTSKRKGTDGYYYECVICDLGGSLLCCDRCPKTYHLECLDPPLKRIPNGKWECPSCQRNGLSAPINHQDLVKRARTKTVIEKSKLGGKTSTALKVCQLLGSSIGKKRSSSKRKSELPDRAQFVKNTDSSRIDVSSSSKFGNLSRDGSVDVSSPCGSVDSEKKRCSVLQDIEKVPESETADRKSNQSVEDALSPPRQTDLETNSESAEKKPDSSSRIQCAGKGAATTSGVASDSRKRKHKPDKDRKKKKSRVSMGEPSVKSKNAHKNKGKAHLPSTKTKKPQRKRRSVHHRDFASKEIAGSKGIESRQEQEAPSMETMGASDGLTKSDVVPCKIPLSETSFEELLQVDRVLGCRVKEDTTHSPCQKNEVMAANAPLADHDSLDNQMKEPEENAGSELLDHHREEPSAIQDVEHSSDQGQCLEDDGAVDKLQVYRRPVTNECNQVGMQGEVGKELGSHVLVSRDEGKSDFPSEDLAAPDFKQDQKKAKVLFANDGSCDKVLEPTSTDAVLLDGEKTSYEFLVKWVGKSHIHNSWIPESRLKAIAKRKLDNYKAKYGMVAINICEERWKQPQRVIAVRSSEDGVTEAFIKWSGLPYDECTWERTDEPAVEKYLYLIDQFNQFERQTLERDANRDTVLKRADSHHNEVLPLTEQPEKLKGGALFPHQLEALNWLRKCWYRSKNVILADEMGLGKTVSACAFLSSLYFEFKAKLPCLVLVPLSTMPNWMAEFASWAPDLNVVEYHGNVKGRTLIRQYEWHASHPSESHKKSAGYKFNVLLTTYEMVLADSSHLRGIPWEVLIVDEGHRLKNSSSKLFSMLNSFSFQHRVLLTGTPLQNNLGELYNLLNFLQPASFPSLLSFEEKFKDLSSAEKVEELKKLVSPHMLRRLKKDAMQNIPPKTERMVPVELSSIQAEYYRAMLTKNYQILRNIGKGVPQQSMLNIVMQLRKVCNHPYLIPGTEPDSGTVEFLQEMRIKASAKLTVLHSMLKSLRKDGHRVLIFSQMTKLLDILEDYLTVEFGSKTFERVDGSVSVADRQAAIARFNQDKSRFVFLLSTRSCGLGINLATADTVVIYDSDFNPHADIQAMNRAHRIGQSNRLLVYRLVVRASVEERILQLAKKKLMLDQLFVNKSGSQKEVEDILRWGTEELFIDSSNRDAGENDTSKDEALPDTEQKSKRRVGGLGDVYQDKCTEGSCKIIWDENAIFKLLDRSNLQSGLTDISEGDAENDMLGSVKSVEWNDEAEDEEGKTESPVLTDEASAPNSDKREELSGTEENEWDRLLRVRWEKYQNEEEASLGRGKRLRKAVSYREAFAPHLNETISESGGEDDPEREPEPEKEYTPAGRALKEKYARLRARQKERLAQIKALKEASLSGGMPRPEALFELHLSNFEEKEDTIRPMQLSGGQVTELEVKDNKLRKFEVPISNGGTIQRVGRLSKNRFSNHHNSSVKVPGHSSENADPSQNVVANSSTSATPTHLSPVLGLCAPNAPNNCQPESSHRNFLRTYGREGRQENRSDFPMQTSTEKEVTGQEAANGKSKLPEASLGLPLQHLRGGFHDNAFPFPMCPPPFLQRKFPDSVESLGASSADFLQKMGLPKLPFDDKLLPAFPFPTRTLQSPTPDILANLSLGRRGETANGQVPATMPFLPNFKGPLQDVPHFSQEEMDVLPTLSLGRKPNPYPSFPENHRKVLENIAMRTGSGSGSGSSNLLKRKSKVEGWSEDELDSLWIGVRRHGQGNWDAMLRDPRLKFSKYRAPHELASRWEEEQLKILDASPAMRSTKQAKSHKSALLPSISDEMMSRALHGSRLGGPVKFQSHLTDIKLGFGDLSANLFPFEPSSFAGLHNEHYSPLQPLGPGNFSARFRDLSTLVPDIQDTSSNVPMEHPMLHDPFAAGSSSSLGLHFPGGYEVQQDNGLDVSRYPMPPSHLNRSLNIFHGPPNDVGTSDPPVSSSLPNLNNTPNLSCLKGKEVASESSSSKHNLPHWLREAVGVTSKSLDPEIPPAVTAIAESVRLLYAEEKPAIPPFVAPGPPPPQPKDPRKSLKRKKKRRHHLLGMIPTDIAGSSQDLHCSSSGDSLPSRSMPITPSVPMLPLQSPSAGLMNSSPSSSFLEPIRKASSGLSPSPEVLQLVASCVAPGSCVPINSNLKSTASADNKQPLPLEVGEVNEEVRVNSPRDLRVDRSHSGDSSKTQSDPPHAEPEAEEISSEKTVSDQTGDNGP